MRRDPGKHFQEKLSSDKIQHFCQLLTKLDSPSAATSIYVQSGTSFNAHLDSSIVTSDDNRHMTRSSKCLQNYIPKRNYVIIANGSLTHFWNRFCCLYN